MNTKMKGDIAESAVVLKALEFEWAVSIPVGDRLTYDLIIDIKGTLLKVQIKVVSKSVSLRRVYMSKDGAVVNKYTENDYDFLVAYNLTSKQFYVIPISDTIGKSTMTLNEKSEYKEAWKLMEDCQRG